jgi:hypothetical protein
LILFLPFLAKPHPKHNRPGAALEGCPYAKTNQQKTARIISHPNRFLFFLVFLIFFWPGP